MGTIESQLSTKTVATLKQAAPAPQLNNNIERWTKFYSLRKKLYWKSKIKNKDGTITETNIKIKDMLDIHLKRVIKLINERSKSKEDIWYTYPASQWVEIMSKELQYRSDIVKEVLGYFSKNKPRTAQLVSDLQNALNEEIKEIEQSRTILKTEELTEELTEEQAIEEKLIE